MEKNSRKQDEVKKMVKRSNYIKRAAHIIKQGRSYDNILSSVSNLLSVTKTMKDSTDSILQATIPLSFDTLKEAFIHIGGKIINCPKLNT